MCKVQKNPIKYNEKAIVHLYVIYLDNLYDCLSHRVILGSLQQPEKQQYKTHRRQNHPYHWFLTYPILDKGWKKSQVCMAFQ